MNPLCFTLALELQEREQHGIPAYVPPRHTADLSAYTAVSEGLLKSGEAPTAHDLHKLHLFQLSHGVSDAEHADVLGKLGISAADWAAIVARTRREAAGVAGAK